MYRSISRITIIEKTIESDCGKWQVFNPLWKICNEVADQTPSGKECSNGLQHNKIKWSETISDAVSDPNWTKSLSMECNDQNRSVPINLAWPIPSWAILASIENQSSNLEFYCAIIGSQCRSFRLQQAVHAGCSRLHEGWTIQRACSILHGSLMRIGGWPPVEQAYMQMRL